MLFSNYRTEPLTRHLRYRWTVSALLLDLSKAAAQAAKR